MTIPKLHSSHIVNPGHVARLLHFGGRGSVIHYSDTTVHGCHCQLQGYDRAATFGPLTHWWAHKEDEFCSPWSDLAVAAEGIPVVDTSLAVKTAAGRSWVFRGPLVDVDLPDGASDDCPEPDPIMVAAIADNEFGAVLANHVTQKANGSRRGSLDSVSVAEYVQGWREHGARIGRAFRDEDGTARIVWES